MYCCNVKINCNLLIITTNRTVLVPTSMTPINGPGLLGTAGIFVSTNNIFIIKLILKGVSKRVQKGISCMKLNLTNLISGQIYVKTGHMSNCPFKITKL